MTRAAALLVCFIMIPATMPLVARSAECGQAASAAPADPASAAVAGEKLSTTSHAIRLDGRDIKYTATAGTLPLKDAAGKVVANMFFVAYVRDGEDRRTRPLTFFFNGGPGSASIWLHMGSLGPRRVQMAEEGFQPAPPGRLVDNESTALDVSDLVFVDAMSTGYSRAAAGEDARKYHGVRADIRAFGEFIRTYVTRFNRWASPKFLAGESYGTMRSAGLAHELQATHGIELNGVILISSILDYMTKGYVPGNDVPYAVFLPSFTASAWYHKKLAADLQALPLKAAVEQSRQFAWGEYLSALVKGNRLGEAERKAIAQKVSRFSGLSAEFIEQANLRVTDPRFRKELLRDRRLMIGRLDGRFTGLDADAAGETQEFDPSNTALQGAYTAMFGDYVRGDLKWESDLKYDTSGSVRPWSYDEFTNRYLNLIDELRQTMARNPYLHVLVANGYFDFATPFGGTEYSFAHLGHEQTYKDRVELTYYEGGHMMYIRASELKRLKDDIARFIRTSVGSGRQTNTQ
jgi:carboxypeptidase C (cathepsin A)